MTAQQNVPAFQDPYQAPDLQQAYNPGSGGLYKEWNKTGNTGIPGFFRRMFGFDTKADQAIRTAQMNQAYERASIESARAWSEYMDNTQVQRRVKDIEDAGLNPWLALQNSSLSGSSAPAVDTGGSAQASNSGEDHTSDLVKTMLYILGMVFGQRSSSGKGEQLTDEQKRYLKNLGK